MTSDTWADPRLGKRHPDNRCGKCGKLFLPGHRVQPVYIMMDPNARNPKCITERGVELGSEYEFAHCDCKNPYLEEKRIITT